MDEAENVQEMVQFIKDDIMFATIFNATTVPFIFIIDEWDYIFREHKKDKAEHDAYLKFLRNLLKNQPYVVLVYMTGILPIKKYGGHSALNMFEEYSMTGAEPLEEFVGFTEGEVERLCRDYGIDFAETKSGLMDIV